MELENKSSVVNVEFTHKLSDRYFNPLLPMELEDKSR
jgi:hypothetical protein